MIENRIAPAYIGVITLRGKKLRLFTIYLYIHQPCCALLKEGDVDVVRPVHSRLLLI